MMHCGAKLCAALAAAIFCLPAAGQNDPLTDFLNRRGYDRDAILRQFPPDPPSDANAARDNFDEKASSAGAAAANSFSDAPAAPSFLPLRPPSSAPAASDIALVLPTLADGIAGEAARNFYRGCLRTQAAGGGAEIRLYAFDGAESEAVRHYAAAAADGAAVVVGPMLKKNVRALLAAHPRTPSRTLLLQPGEGDGYYVMTLDAAREAADLARMLHEQFGGAALIVEQPGAHGERLRAAFARQWTESGGAPPARFAVSDAERDWRRLFDMLKEETGAAAVIFAAGDAAFAVRARNFAPQRNPVFAISTANDGARTDAALLLENLGFMEMPWFTGLDESLADWDSPSARAMPFLRQRFFALGTDACRAARLSPGWREGWILRGLAGDWRLRGDVFIRAGRLAAYRAGRLRLL